MKWFDSFHQNKMDVWIKQSVVVISNQNNPGKIFRNFSDRTIRKANQCWWLMYLHCNKSCLRTQQVSNNSFTPVDRAVFIRVLKGNWFCLPTLHETLKKLWPLFYPIRIKTKSQSWFARPHFPALCVSCYSFEFWLDHWIVCVLCDWLEWWLWFGFPTL